MVLHHQRIIHFVDMVARQNDDVLGFAGADEVQVLKDGVGGFPVLMLLTHALLRRKQIDHFIELRAQETPAALQMPHERM